MIANLKRRITDTRTKTRLVRIVGLAVVVLALTVGLVALPTVSAQGTPPSTQTGPIKLEVEAGYEGYYRVDKWLPLLVNVTNTGPDITGELRVNASGTPGLSAGSFTTNVDLPNGASKQFFLYITLDYNAYQVKVELANDSGVIADDTRNLRALASADLLYAVITESPRGTVDLQAVKVGSGDTRQINWRLDNIPEHSPSMQSIDMMVLTDADTGKLSTAQRSAVQDWVRAGGHLVVTGGPNWQKTQAGVADILPIKPSTNTTLVSLPSIAKFAGHGTDSLLGPQNSPIVAAQGEPTADAVVLAQDGGVPLLARHNVGEGVVDYLAVDPGLEPLSSWNERIRFWQMLLTTTGQQPSWSNGIINASPAEQAANLIKSIRLPDVFQLCGFLAIYIIIIGPLNYLILKRIGRRELAWLTIPLIIVSCSFVAYATGFSLRGTQATINRIALVQAWPNTDRAQVDALVSVLAPRRGVYSLTVHDGFSMRSLDNSSSGNGAATGNFGPTIVQYPEYQARNVPVDAGLTAAFTSSGFIQAPQVQGRAEIELQTPRANTRRTGNTIPHVVGSVTNTSGLTLEHAVVLALGGKQEVGTLNPGDTASFDIAMSISNPQSPPLTLGNFGAGRFFTAASYNNSSSNYYNPTEITVQDIMASNYAGFYGYYGGYSFGYGDNPQQQEFRRRQAFLRAIATDPDPSGGRGDGIYLVGWTNTSPLNVDLDGASYLTEDTTLYMFRLPVTVKPSSTPVELPLSLLTWVPMDDTSQAGITPYNISMSAGDKAVFRYNPVPAVRMHEVTEINVLIQGTAYTQGTLSLWDWTENKWVDIGATGPVTVISQPDKFVGPANTIQLRVEPAPGSRLLSFDRIDLAIVGRTAPDTLAAMAN